eukprot:TRINITY_DN62306_c0_g1_i1.p1 TRINITY_DN62306_c0_g1~~TRINITY_DN62306_c0_g1_i1.p1  ORF type:complete len:266 (+),score=31.74 TRINITY_DN62306_c0_g1_i1:71-868(+)
MIAQQAWEKFASSMSDFQLFSLGYVAFMVTYWCVGLAFLALEFARPAWASHFKCQPEKHVTGAVVRKVARNVIVNQLTTHIFCFLLVWPVAQRRLSFSSVLPSPAEVLCTLLAYAVMTEVMFYYGHRALHIPVLYKHIHKQHHEIKSPFAICALYFHPLEHAQATLEAVVPAIVLKSHVSLLILWICMATFNVLLHHCGYDWEPYWPDSLKPFFHSMTQQHDYHHAAFDRCFGVLGLLDWLHGTDVGLDDHMRRWQDARTKVERH